MLKKIYPIANKFLMNVQCKGSNYSNQGLENKYFICYQANCKPSQEGRIMECFLPDRVL
jgi:hypothetical protein